MYVCARENRIERSERLEVEKYQDVMKREEDRRGPRQKRRVSKRGSDLAARGVTKQGNRVEMCKMKWPSRIVPDADTGYLAPRIFSAGVPIGNTYWPSILADAPMGGLLWTYSGGRIRPARGNNGGAVLAKHTDSSLPLTARKGTGLAIANCDRFSGFFAEINHSQGGVSSSRTCRRPQIHWLGPV